MFRARTMPGTIIHQAPWIIHGNRGPPVLAVLDLAARTILNSIKLKSGQQIAIVGIGGIFPGAGDLSQFWDNIINARDLSREPPPGRWLLSPDQVWAAGQAPDKVYSRRACFVDDIPFDTEGLDIDREYLQALDPMVRLLLHAGRKAWRDAVTSDVDRERTGIILGNIALPTDTASGITDGLLLPLFESQWSGRGSDAGVTVNPINGYVTGLPAGLLARTLGLGGGSYTLDAACASSLYALKYAVDELSSGRADTMLAGGLSRPDPLYTQMGFSALTALSATGHCAPFDHKADGLVVGEGCGIVVLKRLDDALRAGDHIYALVAGIGLSNDIGGNLMAPDSEGQLRAMRGAYRQAQWQPHSIDLIECHGTGTPVGDATEFNSLMSLWDDNEANGACIIGSVKSNIGHLLTAAGAAGLVKVLLAMKYRCLPPTANFKAPSAHIDLKDSPFTVLDRVREWRLPDSGRPRRAAVSAFGFGGINAHVLLEEWNGDSARTHITAPRQHEETIAVIGMEACFGPWKTLAQFRDRVCAAAELEDIPATTPPGCWGAAAAANFKGYFIDEVAIPIGRFRIPPTELEDMLPQQLLMLQVAANAINDAGVTDHADLRDAGIYIGIGLDLNTTNFHLRWSVSQQARKWIRQYGIEASAEELQQWLMQLQDAASPPLSANRTMGALGGIVASRIARAFGAGGPSFTLANEEASGLRALEAGVRALQRCEINLAVTGAVDLAGDIRALLCHNAARRAGGDINPWAFSPGTDGGLAGEGAAALILKRHTDALRDGDRVYALIRGVGSATGGHARDVIPDSGTYQRAVQRCLENAAVSIDSIGYVEVHGGTDPREQSMETEALTEMFRGRANEIPAGLGDCKADIGHPGAAGGMASLVKACLCLYHTTLPLLRHAHTLPPASKTIPLFAPRRPQYFLHNSKDGPRRALVNAFSIDGNCISALLEGISAGAASSRLSVPVTQHLFALGAAETAALLEQLRRLAAIASSGSDIHSNAWHWHQDQSGDRQKTLSLLAASTDELLAAIPLAADAVREHRPVSGEHVYYRPEPLGSTAKVAFVFPGSGNHFHGMGREAALFRKDVMDRLDDENDFLASQFAGAGFWSGDAPAGLSHQDLIFGQVWLGTLMSDLVAGFGVSPDAVIGYSLGETAGLFASRAWTDRDLMLERIRHSPLFTRDLAGPCAAVRTAWGMGPIDTVNWQVGMVDCSAVRVQEAIAGRSRVYLLIINTPDECVIGGDREAVRALVADLACNFHPIEGVIAVHCEVVQPVARAYRDLHLFHTTPPPGVTFYSGVHGGPYAVTEDSAADSIVGQALRHFDYTRVIDSAWDNGVRIFIEMGPGATCTRMIDRILGERTHLATALCVKGQSEGLAILRLLARLHAEGVPVDLTPLYARPPEKDAFADHKKIVIPVGRKSLTVPPPPNKSKVKSEKYKEPEFRATSHEPRKTDVALGPDTSRVHDLMAEILEQATVTETAHAEAQAQFLKVANGFNEILSELQSIQLSLLQTVPPGTDSGLGTRGSGLEKEKNHNRSSASGPRDTKYEIRNTGFESLAPHPSPLFNRAQCLEFATGSIAKVLGPRFAEADTFPTRVRLPDEPLMLVDRILAVEGEPASMAHGRVITGHDVRPYAWYLDGGRIPTCIAVEAGQADLFLSAYLGIDLHTRGLAMYRLLDAEVTFLAPLPRAGETIQYDIHIDHFFRQGNTWLFRFHFEGSVADKPMITMRNGCAGFFTQAELQAGQGIVLTSMDRQLLPGVRPHDWSAPAAMQRESYSDAQIEALREGRLAQCFGPAFAGLPLQEPMGLPDRRMTLVHRVLDLDPAGGRFGIGQITGEADIHADDWFLTCHFVDDQVMPGTLMYECCLHTLRIYLLRMGWVGETGSFVYEPVHGVNSKLKCRGQVTASTQRVQYEITLKEYGYREDGTPYVIADALMYADGRAIVQMTDMSLHLSGLTRQLIEATWHGRQADPASDAGVLFDYDSILAFATGKPSAAFGDRYQIFDKERVIARLPGPPFQFLDRIVSIRNCRQWELAAGAVIEAHYDVPADAWYFQENRQRSMPFSVLLEVALQPCGWLAAYLGSALTSDQDLSFRNLGGEATQWRMLTPDVGTLRTTIKIADVSRSGGMIIQHFEFQVNCAAGPVYEGRTYFGFFTRDALANQIGIRDARLYQPSPGELSRAGQHAYPDHVPFPADMMRMIDSIDLFDPAGGPHGLGFIQGTARVDPGAWFFKAHFYQDPVWPGSLGLESMIQLLKVAALRHWGEAAPADVLFESMGIGKSHQWSYRGQILPTDHRVSVEATIKRLNHGEKSLCADGFLCVDGRIIYQMTDFTLTLRDR